MAEGHQAGLESGSHVQFPHDTRDMSPDGSFRDSELSGEYPVRLASRQAAQNFPFPRGQARQCRHINGNVERPGLYDRGQVNLPLRTYTCCTEGSTTGQSGHTGSGGQSLRRRVTRIISLLASLVSRDGRKALPVTRITSNFVVA